MLALLAIDNFGGLLHDFRPFRENEFDVAWVGPVHYVQKKIEPHKEIRRLTCKG